ncbi:MAG: hypothetical protein AB7T06_33135 [Kofleriaceae bacterium]
MTRTFGTSFALALALALVAACSKNSDSKGDPAAKVADKPAYVWKKIASLGIEVEVAPDADVQDNTASAGFPAATIYSMDGTPTTFIFGGKTLDESIAISKDLESTKTRLQKDNDGFKGFSKEEKAADGVGFELRYSAAGVIDKDETLYGILIRSNVGELTLDCKTNASSEAEIEMTARLCTSIRAAK